MTICRKCGTSNHDGKKYCVFCHELLIADPVEMEKRAAAAQKQQNQALKKLGAKQKRWKRAPFLLIPIGLLDFLNLLLCLDLAFVGIGGEIGRLLGDVVRDLLGPTLSLFGNLVYTDQTVEYILRALEFLGALGLLLIACLLVVIMVVRMIKWRRYRKQADAAPAQTEQAVQDDDYADAAAQAKSVEQIKDAMGARRVSYAVLAAADQQRRAYASSDPASEIAVAELFGALRAHLWEYDEDSVRRILCAMSASRLLLCSAGALDSASIFEHLSAAFGSKAQQFSCPEADGETMDGIARVLLQRDAQTDELRHTSFASALYTASFSPKRICLAGVNGVNAEHVESVFSPLAPYFSVPEGNVALYLGEPDAQNLALPQGIDQGKMVLPANLWMLSVLPEQDRAPDMHGSVARYAAAVYLRNSGRAFPPEDAEGAQEICASVDAFARAVAAAENDYYLSDELWHVIDLVEQGMVDMGAETLSNRTLRMFEKYTATYLACGGKTVDAFDNGFAAVIVPACAEGLRALAQRTEGEKLSALLERTVGREKLPVTTEVLTSMNLI